MANDVKNAEITKILQSDPRWQAALQDPKFVAEMQGKTHTGGIFGSRKNVEALADQILNDHGIKGTDFHTTAQGTAKEDSWWGKHGMTVNKIGSMALGGLAGGQLLGLLGSGGAAPTTTATTLNAAPTIPTVGFEGLGSTVAPTAAHAAGTAGGVMGAIGKGVDFVKNHGSQIGDVGKILTGFGAGEANNRVSRGELTQNYDRIKLLEAENRRQDEAAALKNLYHTGYITSGGRPYSASAAAPYTFGFGPTAPSAGQRTGAASLEKTLINRLGPGGSYTATPLDSYANRGIMEQIANYGGLAAGIGGVLAGGQAGTTAPTGAPATVPTNPYDVGASGTPQMTNADWGAKLAELAKNAMQPGPPYTQGSTTYRSPQFPQATPEGPYVQGIPPRF